MLSCGATCKDDYTNVATLLPRLKALQQQLKACTASGSAAATDGTATSAAEEEQLHRLLCAELDSLLQQQQQQQELAVFSGIAVPTAGVQPQEVAVKAMAVQQAPRGHGVADMPGTAAIIGAALRLEEGTGSGGGASGGNSGSGGGASGGNSGSGGGASGGNSGSGHQVSMPGGFATVQIPRAHRRRLLDEAAAAVAVLAAEQTDQWLPPESLQPAAKRARQLPPLSDVQALQQQQHHKHHHQSQQQLQPHLQVAAPQLLLHHTQRTVYPPRCQQPQQHVSQPAAPVAPVPGSGGSLALQLHGTAAAAAPLVASPARPAPAPAPALALASRQEVDILRVRSGPAPLTLTQAGSPAVGVTRRASPESGVQTGIGMAPRGALHRQAAGGLPAAGAAVGTASGVPGMAAVPSNGRPPQAAQVLPAAAAHMAALPAPLERAQPSPPVAAGHKTLEAAILRNQQREQLLRQQYQQQQQLVLRGQQHGAAEPAGQAICAVHRQQSQPQHLQPMQQQQPVAAHQALAAAAAAAAGMRASAGPQVIGVHAAAPATAALAAAGGQVGHLPLEAAHAPAAIPSGYPQQLQMQQELAATMARMQLPAGATAMPAYLACAALYQHHQPVQAAAPPVPAGPQAMPAAPLVEEVPEESCGSYTSPESRPQHSPQQVLAAVAELALCPLSRRPMADPVVAADGHTYERRNILTWFQRSINSPVTGQLMPSYDLKPNLTIKALVALMRASSSF